jgi:cobalt transporter subunit CbtA
MFARIGTSALFAGFAVGLIAALLHLTLTQPVLLNAELYETGAKVHFGAEGSLAEGSEEALDVMRTFWSFVFTSLMYTGYALIMVALMAYANQRGIAVTVRQGLLWGLAGFITIRLAPSMGLPPEVPGVAAAELGIRQAWWFFTVGATGIALALIAFGRDWKAWGGAIVLLALPHIIGAPHPVMFKGTAPPELGGLFVGRSMGVGLAAWVLLGLFCAYFWQQKNSPEDA